MPQPTMEEVLKILQKHGASLDRGRSGQIERVQLLGQDVNDNIITLVRRMADLRILDIIFTQITDLGMLTFSQMFGLRVLDLGGSINITDAGVKHLAGLSNLEVLRLWDSAISDACLATLAKLPNLRELFLGGTKITGSGFSAFADHGHLKGLDVRASMVDDNGLKVISQMSSLEWLDLSLTEITNTGLKHLYRMKHLQRLQLGSTKVAALGVVDLKRALPNCVISR